jgi:hypothetical protein
MADLANANVREPKTMKKLVFAVTGAATLGLAACSGDNQDSVENVEINQPAAELNDMTGGANDAADAEAAALGTQQQQLESENATAEENTTATPTEEDEQNVSGM